MKKAIKKTVKVKKPKYTISMTEAANIDDITAHFISQKISNGMKMTDCDYDTIASIVMDSLLDELLPKNLSAIVNDGGVYRRCIAVPAEEEIKKPWYKRLWNWITRKK